MSETKRSNEISMTRRAVIGVLALATAAGLGAAINARFDNDRVFQTGPPAAAAGPDTETTVSPETTADNDTVALHIQPGDTAYDLARGLVGDEEDWRPLADKIMAASRALGHSELQPGDVLNIDL